MRPDDSTFRFILTPLLLLFCSIGIYARTRIHTGERLDRLQEGFPILIGLRLFGLALWLAVLTWLVNPAVFAWANLDFPAPLRWCGLFIGLIALAWLMWMFRSLGANLTDTVVTRKKAYLVKSGPYQFVRHPMYIGVLALGIFLSLTTANWLFFVLAAGVFTMMCFRLPIEERNLLARFGDEYRDYMKTTGRFFPKLAR